MESVDRDKPLSEKCSSWSRVESLVADDDELFPESTNSISTLFNVFVNVANVWSSSSNCAIIDFLSLWYTFFSSNRSSSWWSSASNMSRSSSIDKK
jgi:hypothetical protein